MADEVISNRSNQVLLAPGVPGYLAEVTVGDADEKPGMSVTGIGQVHPEVDLRAATETLFGVLLNRSDLDIDTAITAAEGAKGVPCARWRSGAQVYGFIIAGAETMLAGNPLEGASEAGKFNDFVSAMPASDTYNTVAAIAAAKVIADGLPLLMEDYTQDASDDQVHQIML